MDVDTQIRGRRYTKYVDVDTQHVDVDTQYKTCVEKTLFVVHVLWYNFSEVIQ